MAISHTHYPVVLNLSLDNIIPVKPVEKDPLNKACSPKDSSYSLSNVIVADEKSLSFHQYLRYSHKCVTIVFSIPGAII